MKVTNITVTGDAPRECSSWLEHWEKFSGKELPECCQEKSCANKPEFGAFVRKHSSTDRNVYIVPLCGFHNDKKGENIKVRNSVSLVSVNADNDAVNARMEERFWTFQHHANEGNTTLNIPAN